MKAFDINNLRNEYRAIRAESEWLIDAASFDAAVKARNPRNPRGWVTAARTVAGILNADFERNMVLGSEDDAEPAEPSAEPSEAALDAAYDRMLNEW